MDAYCQWAEGQAVEGKPYVTGNFLDTTVVYAYAWDTDDGGRAATSGQEASVIFTGELSHLYNQPLLADPAVAEEVVNELAGVLGSTTGQTRVYVCLGEENWVLHQEDKKTPTQE